MLILASLSLCVKEKMFWSPFPVQVSGPASISLSTLHCCWRPSTVLQRESDSLQITEQDLEHVT